MGEADLAAAAGVLARGDEGQIGAGGLDPGDEAVGQRQRAGAQVGHLHLIPDVERGVERGELQDRRGADPHPLDPAAGAVVAVEGEGRLVAQPAGQGRASDLGVPRGDVDEGRAAGAGVEVFVGAADREIGPAASDVDRQRAGGMGEIPDDQRARRMRLFGQAGHVVPPPGAVIDLGDHHHGDAVVDGILHRLRGDRG